MTDIVELLHGPEGIKAADEIRSLRRENARLREALKPFAVLNDSADPRILGDTGIFAIPLRDLRAARAAMEETDKRINPEYTGKRMGETDG